MLAGFSFGNNLFDSQNDNILYILYIESSFYSSSLNSSTFLGVLFFVLDIVPRFSKNVLMSFDEVALITSPLHCFDYVFLRWSLSFF